MPTAGPLHPEHPLSPPPAQGAPRQGVNMQTTNSQSGPPGQGPWKLLTQTCGQWGSRRASQRKSQVHWAWNLEWKCQGGQPTALTQGGGCGPLHSSSAFLLPRALQAGHCCHISQAKEKDTDRSSGLSMATWLVRGTGIAAQGSGPSCAH